MFRTTVNSPLISALEVALRNLAQTVLFNLPKNHLLYFFGEKAFPLRHSIWGPPHTN